MRMSVITSLEKGCYSSASQITLDRGECNRGVGSSSSGDQSGQNERFGLFLAGKVV
jgi:hypothetical protein